MITNDLEVLVKENANLQQFLGGHFWWMFASFHTRARFDVDLQSDPRFQAALKDYFNPRPEVLCRVARLEAKDLSCEAPTLCYYLGWHEKKLRKICANLVEENSSHIKMEL